MRFSAEPESPYHFKKLRYARVDVTLDGKKLTDVIEASDVEGWADVWKRDALGKLVFDGKGAIERTRLRGVVVLTAIRGPMS